MLPQVLLEVLGGGRAFHLTYRHHLVPQNQCYPGPHLPDGCVFPQGSDLYVLPRLHLEVIQGHGYQSAGSDWHLENVPELSEHPSHHQNQSVASTAWIEVCACFMVVIVAAVVQCSSSCCCYCYSCFIFRWPLLNQILTIRILR